MSGSGAQDRDESMRPVTTLKPFALIADALTSAGMAVLRYDDRGVGGSTGDYASATVDELAGDGRAALEYLRGRSDIDASRIGLLGHSEGGLYAAQLAAADPGHRLRGGPGRAGRRWRVADRGAERGHPAIAGRVRGGDRHRARGRGGLHAGRPGRRRRGPGGQPARLLRGALGRSPPTEDRTILGDREAFIDRQVDGLKERYLSDWFRSFLAYDPAPDWQRVSVPVLGLFGGQGRPGHGRAERAGPARGARGAAATRTSRSSSSPTPTTSSRRPQSGSRRGVLDAGRRVHARLPAHGSWRG